MEKRNSIKNQVKERDELIFRYLPGFARFVLEDRLKDFVHEQLRLMFLHEFPLFRHYDLSTCDEDDLVERSLDAYSEFLTHAIHNTLAQHVEHILEKWQGNQLPEISREQLITEDITLATYTRKKALCLFIPEYTRDVQEALDLSDEIERYCLHAQTRFFNTYVQMQHVKIKRMNRMLRKQRQQLLEAQEIAQLGSFEWDMTGRGNSHNTPQVYHILELEKINALDDIFIHVHPDDLAKLKTMLEQAMNGESYHECEYRYQINDKEKVIWFRGFVEIKNTKPLRLRGTLMDVTERHSMLRELKQNEELYKQAQKLAHIGNWTYEIKTGKIKWSDEIYRICEMEPQCQDISLDFFINLVHPDDRTDLARAFKRILIDHHKDYRLRLRLPSGETKVILAKAEKLNDTDKNKRSLVGTCQDITREVQLMDEIKERGERLEQKNLELQRSNEELGSFNYVASHDLQEPLRKIKTFSDLVMSREHSHLTDNGKMWVERISASAMRMQKLIQDLLSFSATQLVPSVPQQVDLNNIIFHIREYYEELIKSGRLILHAANLPTVLGISSQLRQLFENLISNSLKYSKPDVPIVITITCSKVRKSFEPGQPQKNYACISVADNGIGFEQKYAAKIFEIFQRLHGQLHYSGTGVGLAICKKIAENHKGYIRAQGELNKGSVFSVYLPADCLVVEDQT